VLLGLLGELAGGEFKLHEPPLNFVDLARHALQFHGDPAGRLVHEVDRLIGQEAIGDVAARELGRCDEGRILDLHALVMGLVAGLEPTEDRDRVFDARLANHHGLESPLQGGILFDVLAVLVERGRADAPQLAAGECRLEQVRGVGATLSGPCTDDGMQLVDEQNDVSGRRLHLPQDRLETVLELAAVLGAGDQRPEIEGHHAAAAEVLRHVCLDDPQGETLSDRRLADTGLADEHRIVLGAPGEHLDHAADLGVPTDHGVEFALAGPLRQIDAVLLERLKLLFGILVGDPRLAPNRLEARKQLLLADGRELQHVLRLRRHLGERHQQMVGGDELILHLVRLGSRGLEDPDQFLVGMGLGTP